MLLTQSDPFRALLDLQRSLDLFRSSNWLTHQTTAVGSFPPINVFRQGEDYLAIVELAGLDKASLNVEAINNVIRISGKKEPRYPESASTHRSERVFGSFDRTISLPIRINSEGLKAEYRDGILALFIPQAEEDKPRKINIS